MTMMKFAMLKAGLIQPVTEPKRLKLPKLKRPPKLQCERCGEQGECGRLNGMTVCYAHCFGRLRRG